MFIPEYQSDFPGTPTTIDYVASKGKGVSGLTVLDACAQAFDEFAGVACVDIDSVVGTCDSAGASGSVVNPWDVGS